MTGGWNLKEFSEIAEIFNGNSISKKDKETLYTGLTDGMPYIGTKDVGFDHVIEYDNGVLIPESKAKDFKIAPANSVLVCSEGGSAGRKVAHNIRNTHFGNKLFAIVPGDAAVSKYLYYYTLSSEFKESFKGLITGVIGGVSLKKFKSIKLPVPTVTEQKHIVAILDEAFAGIDAAIANTEKNLANARELFERTVSCNYFGDPDEQNWQESTVEALALSEKGAMRTGPFGSQLLHGEFVEDGIPVLGIDNAVENEFKWAKRRYITEEKYQELSRFTVKPGDVLITIMGTCGRCAVIPDDIPTAINTKHLCCISLDKSHCLPEFLHSYFLYHPIAREYLTARAKGAIMAGLNMGIIKEMPVRLPDIKEQAIIVENIISLKEETRRLETIYQEKLVALNELKQSLLQKAFSGELTVEGDKLMDEAVA